MYKVLVVEDDDDIRKIICDYYKNEGYIVVEASNGQEGLDKFDETIDLLVLDIMMPIIDGWTVCRRIRKISDLPIIILTARIEDDDELQGFELKADDYVKKPFSPAVLMARSNLLLSKGGKKINEDDIIQINGIKIDVPARSVYVDGEEVQLTLKEYEILYYLMKNKRIAVSREQILSEVWGYDFIGDSRIVDNHIKKIRKALMDKSKYIHTVFGIGYKFEV